jgi:peptide-methionine (R)-S-oxide reductase
MGNKRDTSDKVLRERLTPEQYHITQEAGTEQPFSGPLLDAKSDGAFVCICCGQDLFSSEHMCYAGSGWPSFWRPLAGDNVEVRRDVSHGMIREEVVCAKCGAHLGHLFNDGPKPSGLRYCINSASLDFEEDNKGKED